MLRGPHFFHRISSQAWTSHPVVKIYPTWSSHVIPCHVFTRSFGCFRIGILVDVAEIFMKIPICLMILSPTLFDENKVSYPAVAARRKSRPEHLQVSPHSKEVEICHRQKLKQKWW
jgi:hypothetical protein